MFRIENAIALNIFFIVCATGISGCTSMSTSSYPAYSGEALPHNQIATIECDSQTFSLNEPTRWGVRLDIKIVRIDDVPVTIQNWDHSRRNEKGRAFDFVRKAELMPGHHVIAFAPDASVIAPGSKLWQDVEIDVEAGKRYVAKMHTSNPNEISNGRVQAGWSVTVEEEK